MMETEQLTDVSLIAVSVDAQSESLALAARNDLASVVLLEDRDHRVIDRYGLLDYSLWAPVPYRPPIFSIGEASFIGDSSKRIFACGLRPRMYSAS